MLSRVLVHISQEETNAAYYSQGLQLHGILSSFQLAIQQEVASIIEDPVALLTYSSAMAINFSALIALYNNHTCADLDDVSGVGLPEQLKMQETALNGLLEVGPSLKSFTVTMGELVQSQYMVSPFAPQCIYAAAVQYKWYHNETGKIEYKRSLDVMIATLRLMRRQWRIGGE